MVRYWPGKELSNTKRKYNEETHIINLVILLLWHNGYMSR